MIAASAATATARRRRVWTASSTGRYSAQVKSRNLQLLLPLLPLLFAIASLMSAAPAAAAAMAQGVAASGLSEGVMLRLARTPFIPAGDLDSPEIVYVFVDTECPYCHELMQRLAGAAPAVQVRYVLVAVLQEVSLPHAAAILDSNPRERLAALSAQMQGRPRPAGAGSRESREAVTTSNLLMQAVELPATPALVYRDADGKIRAVAGAPDEARFAAIFKPRMSGRP